MFCESLVEHPLPDARPVGLDQGPALVPVRVAARPDHPVDARDARRDPRAAPGRRPAAAWARLTDTDNPAIWFLLLPLSGLGTAAGEDMRPEDLYIKMNSRGKPLTEFENFKAHFEKTIQWSPGSRVRPQGRHRLVGPALGAPRRRRPHRRRVPPLHGVRHRGLRVAGGRTDGAGQQLGHAPGGVRDKNPQREAHLDFLFQALDIWVDRSIPRPSRACSPAPPIEGDGAKVRLFFRHDGTEQDPLNLFEACCRSYGETRGRNRVFSLGQTLVLYAVVLHLIEGTDEFPRRIRVLRNLIEASSDELRLDGCRRSSRTFTGSSATGTSTRSPRSTRHRSRTRSSRRPSWSTTPSCRLPCSDSRTTNSCTAASARSSSTGRPSRAELPCSTA